MKNLIRPKHRLQNQRYVLLGVLYLRIYGKFRHGVMLKRKLLLEVKSQHANSLNLVDVEDVSFIPITRTASTSSYDKQPQKGYPRPSSPADLQDIQDLLSKSKPDEEVSQNGGKRLHPLRTPPAAPFSLQPLRPIPSKE